MESNILFNLNLQILDEAQHASIYKGLLKNGKFGVGHKVSDSWTKIMGRLSSAENPFKVICIIHLLIEPFTKEVVEELILPNLEPQEQQKISEIIADESAHISFGQDLIKYCKDKKMDGVCVSALENEAKFFMSQHEGIVNPQTSTRFRISRKSKFQFLENLNDSLNALKAI